MKCRVPPAESQHMHIVQTQGSEHVPHGLFASDSQGFTQTKLGLVRLYQIASNF